MAPRAFQYHDFSLTVLRIQLRAHRGYDDACESNQRCFVHLGTLVAQILLLHRIEHVSCGLMSQQTGFEECTRLAKESDWLPIVNLFRTNRLYSSGCQNRSRQLTIFRYLPHRDAVYLTTYRASQDMCEIEHYPPGLAMNERN